MKIFAKSVIILHLGTVLAMMLVAVIALSGSTFAWFAQNSSVTAEKVTVTAETAKNLSISTTGADNSWQTNVDLTNVDAGTKFWPVAATENSEFIASYIFIVIYLPINTSM